tara:strand:- start:27844 stop:28026 length:183 start_codon:yes stop_codon:yes gene_type:complete
MDSEFDFYCKITKTKAKQVYKPVAWSGDKLACCSSCYQSLWDGDDFKKNHKRIIKTNSAN